MRSLFLQRALVSALSLVTLPMATRSQEPELVPQPTLLTEPLQLPASVAAPPPDVRMREAVEALGRNSHRFVRCRLRSGVTVTGAVIETGKKGFTISQGALGKKLVTYAQLKEVPQLVAAPGEHTLVGLEWAGLIAASVAIAPLALLMGLTCGFQCS